MTLLDLFTNCDSLEDNTRFVVFETWTEYKLDLAPIATGTFPDLPWEIATADVRKFRWEDNTVYAWVEVDE